MLIFSTISVVTPFEDPMVSFLHNGSLFRLPHGPLEMTLLVFVNFLAILSRQDALDLTSALSPRSPGPFSGKQDVSYIIWWLNRAAKSNKIFGLSSL